MVTRNEGPEMLTAAMASPRPSRIAMPAQRTPSSRSSSSTAYPRRLARYSSLRHGGENRLPHSRAVDGTAGAHSGDHADGALRLLLVDIHHMRLFQNAQVS